MSGDVGPSSRLDEYTAGLLFFTLTNIYPFQCLRIEFLTECIRDENIRNRAEYPKVGDIGSDTKPAFKGCDGRRVGKSAIQHINRVVDGFGPHLQWDTPGME